MRSKDIHHESDFIRGIELIKEGKKEKGLKRILATDKVCSSDPALSKEIPMSRKSSVGDMVRSAVEPDSKKGVAFNMRKDARFVANMSGVGLGVKGCSVDVARIGAVGLLLGVRAYFYEQRDFTQD